MSEHKRTLVTCALPYANGPVHVGHLAGAYIPGDIYVRYLRMRGEDVVFVCGSDEHGVPITIKARERGVTPQDIVDQYHAVMKDAFSGLGINFDIYSRTTSKIHDATASEFFRRLYDSDKFITQESEQLYDEQARMFLTDRLIEGTCPKCGQPHAYGDQCEHCGSTLSPDELLDPKSRVSGSTPVKVKTKHWYLPLDQYEPWLRDWILEQHKEWKTNVYGQCKSWLDGGLQPRAVTRDLDWGVPVPVEGAEGKVLYVWFDAPIGYISNTKELLPESWEKWWKDPETRLVHFIGKDNIVFHCIVFPSMLKAYGDFILPENVPANEFLNLEGDKISTSRNWAIWVHEYEEQFPGKEDVLRYVLTANAPETKDNDFTWKDFQQRNNSELVAVFGNFVNRQRARGRVRQLREPCRRPYPQVFQRRGAGEPEARAHRRGDACVHHPLQGGPGELHRDLPLPRGPEGGDEHRPHRQQVHLRHGALEGGDFEPFTPFSAEKLRTILRVGVDAGTDHRAGEGVPTVNFYKPGEGKALHTNVVPSEDIVLSWSMLGTPELLPAGHALGESVLLFEKVEDSVVNEQIARLEAIKAAREAAEAAKAAEEAAKKVEPQKPEVTFDQFGAMELQPGGYAGQADLHPGEPRSPHHPRHRVQGHDPDGQAGRWQDALHHPAGSRCQRRHHRLAVSLNCLTLSVLNNSPWCNCTREIRLIR